MPASHATCLLGLSLSAQPQGPEVECPLSSHDEAISSNGDPAFVVGSDEHATRLDAFGGLPVARDDMQQLFPDVEIMFHRRDGI